MTEFFIDKLVIYIKMCFDKRSIRRGKCSDNRENTSVKAKTETVNQGRVLKSEMVNGEEPLLGICVI